MSREVRVKDITGEKVSSLAWGFSSRGTRMVGGEVLLKR